MTEWGELKLAEVESGHTFIALLNELIDDKSCFVNNAGTLADAFRNGKLYSLHYMETDSMFENKVAADPLFVKRADALYLIPCLCAISDDTIEIIWVHTRARKRGFVKKMVELLNLPYVYKPLPGSEGFWEKCDIEIKK